MSASEFEAKDAMTNVLRKTSGRVSTFYTGVSENRGP